jgi:hypothetical protein
MVVNVSGSTITTSGNLMDTDGEHCEATFTSFTPNQASCYNS